MAYRSTRHPVSWVLNLGLAAVLVPTPLLAHPQRAAELTPMSHLERLLNLKSGALVSKALDTEVIGEDFPPIETESHGMVVLGGQRLELTPMVALDSDNPKIAARGIRFYTYKWSHVPDVDVQDKKDRDTEYTAYIDAADIGALRRTLDRIRRTWKSHSKDLVDYESKLGGLEAHYSPAAFNGIGGLPREGPGASFALRGKLFFPFANPEMVSTTLTAIQNADSQLKQ